MAPGFLYASQEQVLNARHLDQTRSVMERLAAEFGGDYEDWQMSVHMDDWPECGCAWPDGL
jgi:predicted hydrolase (HD superfamily)